MSNKTIVISGEAAEGSGALAGWSGQGTMMRSDLLTALDAAGAPRAWAPRAKSAKAQAGHAIRRLDNRGYRVRAATRSSADKVRRDAGARSWDARWTVAIDHSASAEVGDAVGRVTCAFELTGDELSFTGDGALGAEVTEIFAALRDAEIYQAGEVTAWLSRILCTELGCTRFGVGYYCPPGSRPMANALCAALMTKWGHAWICPLLPVATTDELKTGIARGLSDDVSAISGAMRAARAAATAEGKPDMAPSRAAQLLRGLGEVRERVSAYLGLCGQAIVAPIVAELNAAIEDLNRIATATDQRAALLEIDPDDFSAPPSVAAPAPAPIVVAPPTYRVPAPAPADLPPSDSDIRFGLLELD